MQEWKSVDDVLDFAIGNEQQAADFYMEMAGKVQSPHVKKMFEDNAREEQGHKAKLEAVKSGKKLLSSQEKVLDLKLSNYLVDVQANGDLDFQGALIVAMKREKAAFRLYNDLAANTEDKELKQTFLGLAHEEAKHKLRFEIEYDDEILKEN